MKNQLKKILKYALLIGIVVLSFQVFIPRSYDVPPPKTRAGTQYWNLSTGSTIAYTLIPGKSPKKIYPLIYLHGGPGGPIYDSNIGMLTPISADGYDVYLYDQAAVSYTHLRAHETVLDLVCRLLLEKKKNHITHSLRLAIQHIQHLLTCQYI